MEMTCCDGTGIDGGRADDSVGTSFSRRGLLVGASLGLLGWATRRSALAQVAVGSAKERNVLVIVFLRGGADGLNMLVPHGDDGYYRARPAVGVARAKALDLDGFFGLHPALAPLLPIYHEGRLAAIHAVGSDDRTHSHFEAMDTMERGVADRNGPSSGWVARYLAATESVDPSPLRAVALGTKTPTALVGATHATTVGSLSDYRLDVPPKQRRALEALYGSGKDEISHAGRATLDVLHTLERLDPKSYRPQNGVTYPKSDLGVGLSQVACLVRAEVGMEVACLDHGIWDTHVAQGAEAGWMPTLMSDLGLSLAAFDRDLGAEMGRVTVVVMTEFGRRIAENAGLGTDHGHASAMFLLGGGLRGGRVHGRWPGLDHPVGPGDLAVTTDYRDVLAEVLRAKMNVRDTGSIFAASGARVGVVG